MLRDSRTIVAHLRDEIMALIARDGLQSGDRIPTEAELTRTFGVSRPALRLSCWNSRRSSASSTGAGASSARSRRSR